MYKCIPPLLTQSSPNPSSLLTSCHWMLHFRSAWQLCSVGLCCHRCCTIDIAVCHVALLLVWYAVPLFMCGMCMQMLLLLLLLPLSRWEWRDKKGPVWLFDHFNRVKTCFDKSNLLAPHFLPGWACSRGLWLTSRPVSVLSGKYLGVITPSLFPPQHFCKGVSWKS